MTTTAIGKILVSLEQKIKANRIDSPKHPYLKMPKDLSPKKAYIDTIALAEN